MTRTVKFGERFKVIETREEKRYVIRQGQRRGAFYLLQEFGIKGYWGEYFEGLVWGGSEKYLEELALKLIRKKLRIESHLRRWLKCCLYRQPLHAVRGDSVGFRQGRAVPGMSGTAWAPTIDPRAS